MAEQSIDALMRGHDPSIPGWTCANCGTDWPCPTRRAELLTEYAHAPLSLAIYLGAQYVAAVPDLPHLPAEGLHLRFLGWARRRRPAEQTKKGRWKPVEGTRREVSEKWLRATCQYPTRQTRVSPEWPFQSP
jgi:hypothetical protein